MVLFNYSTKELTAKVVYYGPGLCGKTTNLQWIHEKLPIRNKGKMLSLATETDRTLFFDFLPIELGTIRGMKTRIQLYTVPGQVFYNATRRMVLKGADCVVFVCDSQEAMIDANLESFENLRQNLEANEINADEMPLVLQYNKRDLPNALPIEILNERLNPRGVPFFEAVAVKGQGVEETLKGVTGLVFRSLAAKYGGAEPPLPGKPVAAPAPAVAPRPAPAPVVVAPVAAPPAPSPVPASPFASAPEPRVAQPASSLPALRMHAASPADELLESLELQPASEMEELLPEAPELRMDPGGPPSDEGDEVETVDLDEAFEPPVAAPAPPPAKDKGRITLVSGPRETEDLRRRISRPSLPDLSLDDLDQDDDDLDELSFEPEPAPSPLDDLRVDTLPPGSRAVSSAEPPAAVTAPRPAPNPPAVSAVRKESEVVTVATTPVSVQLPGDHGQTDVSIPVEVTLGRGSAQVTIHLRLTLNLNLQQ
jgi:signal recognition particle receptor subunit beta